MRFGYPHGLGAFRRAKGKLVNIKRPATGRQGNSLNVLDRMIAALDSYLAMAPPTAPVVPKAAT